MSLDFPVIDHPITSRWPARNPGVLQLYSSPTPNGIKVSSMLEETGLAYEAHRIDLAGEVTTSEFLSLNPNNKIPAIVDPDGPGGRQVSLFESGAILIYLAEKTGRHLPADPVARIETIQWLMFQMGGLGPMFGQLGFFVKYAGADIEDPRPRERYITEARRLLAVLERRLEGRDWIMGRNYTIADMAIWPWLRGLDGYGARPLVGWDELTRVPAYLDRALARPASQAAITIPAQAA